MGIILLKDMMNSCGVFFSGDTKHMRDPWDWYVYQPLLPSTSTIHAGKYISPMDRSSERKYIFWGIIWFLSYMCVYECMVVTINGRLILMVMDAVGDLHLSNFGSLGSEDFVAISGK